MSPFLLPPTLTVPRAESSRYLEELGAWLDLIIGAMPLGVLALDLEGLVVLWSKAATRLFGYLPEEVLGKPYPLVPPGGEREFASLMREGGTRQLVGVRLMRQRKDQSIVHIRLWTSQVRNEEGQVVALLGVSSDETAQVLQETELALKTQLVSLLHEVAVAANEADALEPALRRTLPKLCSYAHMMLAHAYVVDAKGALRSSGLWHVDGVDRFETFRRETERIDTPLGSGLPSEVIAAKSPKWRLSYEGEENNPRAVAAKACGIRGRFAFPVLVRQEAVAVVELFTDQLSELSPALIETMQSVGAQLGRVVERARASELRLELEERNRQALAEANALRREKALAPLSPREKEVLRHVANGDDNLKIAAQLDIRERTVKAHLTSILEKLSLENRTQAARFAWTVGLQTAPLEEQL